MDGAMITNGLRAIIARNFPFPFNRGEREVTEAPMGVRVAQVSSPGTFPVLTALTLCLMTSPSFASNKSAPSTPPPRAAVQRTAPNPRQSAPPAKTPPQSPTLPWRPRPQPTLPYGRAPIGSQHNQLRSFPGERVVSTPNGQGIYGRDGKLRMWSGNGMTILRSPGGVKEVSVDRQDGSHVTVLPGGGGWVQHPFIYRGVEYGRRTYALGGMTYSPFYRIYPFHGTQLSVFVPASYYPPAFYSWATQSWRSLAVFSWSWQSSAWYGYYGGAFTPYSYYAAPSMWLTDYMLSNSMDASYRQDSAEGSTAGAPPVVEPISPGVKGAVTGEVEQDLSTLQREDELQGGNGSYNSPAGSIAEILDNQTHTFMTGSKLLVVDAYGTECELTPGDTVEYVPPPPPVEAPAVDVKVTWGKGSQDCRTGSTITVSLQDLQEMHNYMLASASQGTIQMHAQQDAGRLPQAMPGASGPLVSQGFASAAPPADPNVQAELNAESRAADQVEQSSSNP
jgi:hypothetical protein